MPCATNLESMRLITRMLISSAIGVLTLTAIPMGSAAGPSSECRGPAHGRLVDMIALEHLGRDEVAATLQQSGLAASARYGMDRYRLVYCTVSPSGGAAVASGLLVLPQGAPGRLPVVAYAHGTISARTEAPSFTSGAEGRLIPMIFSAEGLAVVAPDYLGLGVSPIPHPYLHADTEASATVDLLAAARTAGQRLRQPLSSDVYVTGFSQGGHAAMAIGQRLSAAGDPWRLRALAPVAGP
jgi:poly(3-hydroxybutyrate) depolymerase